MIYMKWRKTSNFPPFHIYHVESVLSVSRRMRDDSYPASPRVPMLSNQLPHMHHLILTCRGYVRSIRRPCHSVYFSRMTCVSIECIARSCIPDPYRLVLTRRSNIRAIRRPCYCMHVFCVPSINKALFARGCIPDPYRSISTARYDSCVVR